MAEKNVEKPPAEPNFLSYLLCQDQEHDCYFLVGNKEILQPERIGVVKKMLLAHSLVLRTELEESKLAEKGDVSVEDLHPDTFINMLKFIYGHDVTSSLSFDEADNLLYAAEKYMMEPLKARISTRLVTLLSSENICHLLNNPACYSVLELQSTITEILQYQTHYVLNSRAFLDVSPDGFIKILEQEAMSVDEIKVWKAAVKWGKHRERTEEGRVLGEHLRKPMKHIRVCTISLGTFVQEVVPTNILSDSAVKMICLYHGENKKQDKLVEVSNETKPRTMTSMMQFKSKTSTVLDIVEMDFSSKCSSIWLSEKGLLTIYTTMEFGVELLPLEFTATSQPQSTAPEEQTYQFDCAVQITENTHTFNNTSTKTPITVRFSQQVRYGAQFTVPLTSNGENIRLLPDKKYTLNVHFTQGHELYVYEGLDLSPFCQDHIIVFSEQYVWDRYVYFSSPIKKLVYRPIQYT